MRELRTLRSTPGARSSDDSNSEKALLNLKPILSIDPGSVKCGVAVVNQELRVLHRSVTLSKEVIDLIQRLIVDYEPNELIIGSGTGSKALIKQFTEANFGIQIVLVDEFKTSEEARLRYVKENPPTGWKRLIPQSLRTPDAPYDDYVAIILAERYWNRKEKP